jgi:thioesterase domain-containing protein/acyl carrier protein
MRTEHQVRATIRELWSQILEHDGLPGDVDFFAAGGSSLQSLILMTELNEAFATEFEIAELVDCRTIDRQTDAVWNRLHRDSVAVPDQRAVVVPLAAARGSDRQDAVLVAVHDVGGDIYGYTGLAGELAGRADLYGVKLAHERFDEPRALSVPDLAAEYVAVLDSTIGESRRWVVLGWSLGGLVGFEMAKLLDRRGRPAERLVLVDSPYGLEPPAPADVGSFLPEHERALLDELGWVGDGEPLVPDGVSTADMWLAMRKRLDAPGKEHLAAELQRRFPLLARVIPHLSSLNPLEFIGYVNRFRSVLRAGQGYRPAGMTAAPIELLTATRSRNFDPRWCTHTSATFRRRSLDGDHFSILTRGSVHVTAQAVLAPDAR